MAEYRFVTTWRLAAPIERVWELIHAADRWPTWWPCVASVVEVAPGDGRGLGAVRRYTWTTRLPYRLTFDMRTTRVEPPHTLEGAAWGELAGTGRWRLDQSDGWTTVRYDWQVRTTRRWMNLAAPLARPLFRWNHDQVMRLGGEGLARQLGVRLEAG